MQELGANSLDSLLHAATQLGYPLALKIESCDIAHKTEAGGVALNLRSMDEVRAAYERVLANARNFSREAKISGVLLQRMVPEGVEVVMGARIDPLIGPLIVVGFGGVLVELLRDSALELAPISAGEAMSMLQRLKGAALFGGFRGGPAVDLDCLADLLVRLSELAADQQGLIAELDINPVICAGSTLTAVDALIVRAAARK